VPLWFGHYSNSLLLLGQRKLYQLFIHVLCITVIIIIIIIIINNNNYNCMCDSVTIDELTSMDSSNVEESTPLKSTTPTASSIKEIKLLRETYNAISTGAEAFLRAEYSICASFVLVFSLVIFVLISWSQNTALGLLTSLAFVLGR